MLAQPQVDKRIVSIILYLFLLHLAIYLLTASNANFSVTDAGQLRFEVVKSIVERHDLAIPAGTGLTGVDGRDYSWLGIGSTLVAVPFYLAGKMMGSPENFVSLMNQFFSSATAVLVFLFSFSLGYSRRASLLTALCYGFGTFAWPSAKHPFDQPLETFAVLLSVYYLYVYGTDKKLLHLACSAASLGLAVVTRQTSILIFPALLALIAWQRKGKTGAVSDTLLDILRFTVIVLPFAGLILWYNDYRFGSIFESGYTLMGKRLNLPFFSGNSIITGLFGLLASSGKGFFFYSPVAVLFLFCIKVFWKKHRAVAACFALIIVCYLLFFAKYIYWHGDWAWGPRYLLATTPFLIIPLAEIFDSPKWHKTNHCKIVVYLILAVSVTVQIAAVSVDFNKYFIDLKYDKKVRFFVVSGKDVQIIQEPPLETYFDWRMSPLLAQIKFISQISRNLNDYSYHRLPEDDKDYIKNHPNMNIFDLWWLYDYYIQDISSGFLAALMLLFVAGYCGSKLVRIVRFNC